MLGSLRVVPEYGMKNKAKTKNPLSILTDPTKQPEISVKVFTAPSPSDFRKKNSSTPQPQAENDVDPYPFSMFNSSFGNSKSLRMRPASANSNITNFQFKKQVTETRIKRPQTSKSHYRFGSSPLPPEKHNSSPNFLVINNNNTTSMSPKRMVTDNKDFKSQLIEIEVELAERLKKLDMEAIDPQDSAQEYFEAYSDAFNDIIGLNTPYSKILSKIKQAYENDPTIAHKPEEKRSHAKALLEYTKLNKKLLLMSETNRHLKEEIEDVSVSKKQLQDKLQKLQENSLKIQTNQKQAFDEDNSEETAQVRLLKRIEDIETSVLTSRSVKNSAPNTPKKLKKKEELPTTHVRPIKSPKTGISTKRSTTDLQNLNTERYDKLKTPRDEFGNFDISKLEDDEKEIMIRERAQNLENELIRSREHVQEVQRELDLFKIQFGGVHIEKGSQNNIDLGNLIGFYNHSKHEGDDDNMQNEEGSETSKELEINDYENDFMEHLSED